MSKNGNPQWDALEEIDKFQSMLKEAISYGYDVSFDRNSTFPFSPFEVMIDSAIDIFLIIRKYLSQGIRSQRPNQGLGFSNSQQDVLGNPKQFRINYPSKYYWDPQAEKFFFRLAEAFIRIKNQEPIKQSFVHLFEDLELKPPIRSTTKSEKEKRRSTYNWWRRQQRRSRR
jgi:hypothetical protein